MVKVNGVEWTVTDRSYTTKGFDPTVVGIFVLTSGNREFVITEFFGDYHVTDANEKVVFESFKGPKTLDEWLKEMGLPDMDQIGEELHPDEGFDNPDKYYYGHA